jgi:hypothetical protein
MNSKVLSGKKNVLSQRISAREHEVHQKRLREMKPTFNTYNKNSHFRHLHKKLKKEQLLEGTRIAFIYLICVDRFTEIERENRILLEKMTHIMHTKNAIGANASYSHKSNIVYIHFF